MITFQIIRLTYLYVDVSYNAKHIEYIIVLFVETPRKFITAKLSIRKPGSSSVLIISDILLALMKIRAYGSKALQ